jgi:hypothetical protein
MNSSFIKECPFISTASTISISAKEYGRIPFHLADPSYLPHLLRGKSAAKHDRSSGRCGEELGGWSLLWKLGGILSLIRILLRQVLHAIPIDTAF